MNFRGRDTNCLLNIHSPRLRSKDVTARNPRKETIQPMLSTHQAIGFLQRQIERLEQQIISLPHDHPDVEAWVSTTTDILNQAFGQPTGEMHSKTNDFAQASSGLPNRRVGFARRPNPQDSQQRYILNQEKIK